MKALFHIFASSCFVLSCSSPSGDGASTGRGASATQSARPGGGGSARPTDSGAPRASASAGEETIPCKADSECPTLPCGPCTPGALVTKTDLTVMCTRNPCKGPASVCNPGGRCAVGPKVEKDPAVFGSASP